jgi:hypothetical protein
MRCPGSHSQERRTGAARRAVTTPVSTPDAEARPATRSTAGQAQASIPHQLPNNPVVWPHGRESRPSAGTGGDHRRGLRWAGPPRWRAVPRLHRSCGPEALEPAGPDDGRDRRQLHRASDLLSAAARRGHVCQRPHCPSGGPPARTGRAASHWRASSLPLLDRGEDRSRSPGRGRSDRRTFDRPAPRHTDSPKSPHTGGTWPLLASGSGAEAPICSVPNRPSRSP